MHSELENLGESVWSVSSSGVREHTRRGLSLLCLPPVSVRLEDADSHEDLSDQESCGEGNPEVGQIRFQIDGERVPSLAAIEKRFKAAAIEEAKRLDEVLAGKCPICNNGFICDNKICVRWKANGSIMYCCGTCFAIESRPQWKKDYAKQVLAPIPADTWDYLNHPG